VDCDRIKSLRGGKGSNMILYLARHGETEWHAENRYAGITDVALTPKGVEQGIELAKWAANADVDLIVSSDLSRAIITAIPSVQATNVEHKIDPRFREVDFGLGEGLTSDEMQLIFPEARNAFVNAPADSAFPDGERGVDAVKRAFEALFELISVYRAEKVLLVAHSTLGRLMLCALTGIDLNNYRKEFPIIINGAVTTIEVENVAKPSELYGAGQLIELNKLH
jgi:broad specificity phosphatase PhoE